VKLKNPATKMGE
jgi:serine/threonine protein kinase